jgi:predicted nucleic acid-binding protein
MFLLDTDVFSFSFKKDTRAELYRPLVLGVQVCVSFQTVAELRLWAITHNWGEPRRRELDDSLRRCIVLSYDNEWPIIGLGSPRPAKSSGGPFLAVMRGSRLRHSGTV